MLSSTEEAHCVTVNNCETQDSQVDSSDLAAIENKTSSHVGAFVEVVMEFVYCMLMSTFLQLFFQLLVLLISPMINAPRRCIPTEKLFLRKPLTAFCALFRLLPWLLVATRVEAETLVPVTLLHRYSFNDGTAGDSVGSAAGTLYGTSLPSITAGTVTLNSVDQRIQLPANVLGSCVEYSVEMWVSTGTNANLAPLFSFGTDATTYASLIYVARSAELISATWNDIYSHTCTATSTIKFDGQTNMHVVLTVTATFITLYVNSGSGSSVTSTNCSSVSFALNGVLPTINYFYVGHYLGGTLVGSVDEFRLWQGIVSATDVSNQYSIGPSEYFAWPRDC